MIDNIRMKNNFEHIVSCFRNMLGRDNIIAIWKSMRLSNMCGIDVFYAVIRSGKHLSRPDGMDLSLLMSVEMTSETNTITEMYYGNDEYHVELSDEDIIIYADTDDVETLKTSPFPPNPPRDDKGYYAVKSVASSILAKRHGTYEECFDTIRTRAQNEQDTTSITYQQLLYMHDKLASDIVLDWFQHDTPLIRRLRHSSPFSHESSRTPKTEYDALIYDIVNHPEKYHPLPSHQIWLESILAAGGLHINDFTKQFIPENRLSE